MKRLRSASARGRLGRDGSAVLLPTFIFQITQSLVENPSFFLKGDVWVGTGTEKKYSKLECNGWKTEEGHLVNWWGKCSLSQKSQ